MVLDASITSTDNTNGDDDGNDEDSADEGSSDDDDDNNRHATNSNSDEKANGKLGRRLQISHLLKMVLQDAQTRLFFRAQSVIQSDIRHFVPKVDDLAYPDLLVGMCFLYRKKKEPKMIFFSFSAANKESTGTEISEKESVSQIFRVPSLDKQDTWYPTLRKTVWVLEQLHDFVKVCMYTRNCFQSLNLSPFPPLSGIRSQLYSKTLHKKHSRSAIYHS